MIQAAGHAGVLKQDEKSTGFILKPLDEAEAANYESLWSNDSDPLQEFVPRWGGKTDVAVGSADSGDSRPFMRIGNLLEGFKKPCVMDCKMGVRTFQEKEAKVTKLRPDLYQRLNELTPELLSKEDHEAGAITKFQWTVSRDAVSTSKLLGFRIDGIVSEQGPRIPKKELDEFCTQQEVIMTLPRVLPHRCSRAPVVTEDIDASVTNQRMALVRQIVAQLERVRDAMENSVFFKTHEFVGASFLFVVGAELAKVFLIDLAKTTPLPEGVLVDRRSDWEMGNHEDGLLKGVDNLVDCWTSVLILLENSKRRRTTDVSAAAAEIAYNASFGDSAMQALEDNLCDHGVDTSKWGIDGAKSLEELHEELHEERAISFELDENGRLLRVMDVVKLWILVDLGDGEMRTLMEPKRRKRNSTGSHWKQGDEEMEGKPPQQKVGTDQRWEDAMYQAIADRLDISAEEQKELFEWRWNTYRKKIQVDEGRIDHGYLGLWSRYSIHEIDLVVKDPKSQRLAPLGLPDGMDFMTVQKSGFHSAFGHRQHAWRWVPVSKTDYAPKSFKEQTRKSVYQIDKGDGKITKVNMSTMQSPAQISRTMSAGDWMPCQQAIANKRQTVSASNKSIPEDDIPGDVPGDASTASRASASSCCCGIEKWLSTSRST